MFSYERSVDPSLAISLTMPPRTASWNSSVGLAPIFEMNLPEGALRERLRLAFAKATGSFDEIDLLSVVGRSQIGRIRFTGMEDTLDEAVPFQSVDEILTSQRSGELYRYLIERFASSSGVSGVQPKVLIRDEVGFTGGTGKKSDFSETSPRQLRAILEQISDALSQTAKQVETSMRPVPDFQDVGGRILSEWHGGIAELHG
jgi:HipA-like protein